jgi:hypothetical protein
LGGSKLQLTLQAVPEIVNFLLACSLHMSGAHPLLAPDSTRPTPGTSAPSPGVSQSPPPAAHGTQPRRQDGAPAPWELPPPCSQSALMLDPPSPYPRPSPHRCPRGPGPASLGTFPADRDVACRVFLDIPQRYWGALALVCPPGAASGLGQPPPGHRCVNVSGVALPLTVSRIHLEGDKVQVEHQKVQEAHTCSFRLLRRVPS